MNTALLFALIALLLAASPATAEDTAYSSAFDLQPYIVTTPAASQSGPDMDIPHTLPSLPIEAQYAATVMVYGDAAPGQQAFHFYDTCLTGRFFLHADPAGNVYLDPSAQALPGEIIMDEDCMSPPYQRTISCDTADLRQWGWRTEFVRGDVSEQSFYRHMALGDIDPLTGQLIGYTPSAAAPVYLVYKEPLIHYRLSYYDAQGVQVSGGWEYALPGSDLRHPPAHLRGLYGGDVSLLRLGSSQEAPSFASGAVHLQIVPKEPVETLSGAPFTEAFQATNEISIQAAYLHNVNLMTGDATRRMANVEGYDPVQRCEITGQYYIHPESLPEGALADAFYSEILFNRQPEMWRWGYAMEDTPFAMTAEGDRWYFGEDFRWADVKDGCVYLAYLPETTAYGITLLDDDGTLLDASLYILEKGDLSAIQTHKNVRLLLPAEKREQFATWTVYGAEDPALPAAVLSPVVLAATYKIPDDTTTEPGDTDTETSTDPDTDTGTDTTTSTDTDDPTEDNGGDDTDEPGEPVTPPGTYPVSFLLSEDDALPYAIRHVKAGALLDMAKLPAPSRAHARFIGWMLYDPLLGNTGIPFQPESPITCPMTLIAQFEDMLRIAFLAPDGALHAEQYVAFGDMLDLAGISAPEKNGLAFLAWETAAGESLLPGWPVWTPLQLRPVFAATVTFFDGQAAYAERTVREGEFLWDIPAPPHHDNALFLGWSIDLSTHPIRENTLVYAEYGDPITNESYPTPELPTPTVDSPTPPYVPPLDEPSIDAGDTPLDEPAYPDTPDTPTDEASAPPAADETPDSAAPARPRAAGMSSLPITLAVPADCFE